MAKPKKKKKVSVKTSKKRRVLAKKKITKVRKKRRKVSVKSLAKPKVKKRSRKVKAARKKVRIRKKAKRKLILKKKIVFKKKKTKKIKSTKTKKALRKKSLAKPRTKRVKPVKTNIHAAEFPSESLFRAKIKVIGVGGGGGSIVSEIGRSLAKATFVIADTDIRALKKRPGIKYLWFGENLTHGLGTGVNVELAKRAAEEAKEKIGGIFEDQDIIIFIAALGGGLGSGATQVFAEAAKEFGGITLGIFTLPFKFEGKNKQKIAQNALKSLRQSLNVSLTIPNEKIFKIIDANTPITDAFSIVNKSLIESLESLIDLIYNPGIINIDFADLRTILKGRGNLAFLNTIEESGKDRAEKVCEKVFFNPLLQNSSFTAEKILFNVAGSQNLSMFEVEKISRRISELNPEAKIIFGISRNLKLKNKIKTTILMTGGGLKTEIAGKKAEAVKVPETVEEKTETAEKPPVAKKKKSGTKPPRNKKRMPRKKAKEKKDKQKKEKIVSLLPVFQAPIRETAAAGEKKLSVIEKVSPEPVKKAIRRSGVEVKKAQDLEEKKRLQQEKEWEIPAFLRRVKFKS